MGKLIDGKWIKKSIITLNKKGAYDRLPRTFLNTISNDHEIFKPESNRYHLYVSHACPWATRTMIYRKLKELESHISVSVVHPDMLEDGWKFDDSFNEATVDRLYGFKYLRQVYQKADSRVTTSVTVPILWDKKTQTIVNNESSQIIRIFNSAFNGLTYNQKDYYPQGKRLEIDGFNELIYQNINNGVYKTGFARTQESYDIAVRKLFDTLDELDQVLDNKKFLTGDSFNEADIRLIPTLLRFDLVYVTHFKCNLKRIIDYPNLSRYVKDMLKIPAVKETFHPDHIKRHYYYSHAQINPYRIIPKGPIDLP